MINELKEQQEILRKGEKLNNFVNSNDWQYVKDKLNKMIKMVDSIEFLPVNEIKNIEIEVRARNGAINLIRDWINIIEGEAEQIQSNKEMIDEVDYIKKI